jgi:hypothetical protein
MAINLNVTLHLYFEYRSISGSGLISIFIGLFTGGCLACGLPIIMGFVSSLGIISLGALPFDGLLIYTLSFVILLLSISYIGQKI